MAPLLMTRRSLSTQHQALPVHVRARVGSQGDLGLEVAGQVGGVAAPVSDSASAVEPCQTSVHKRSRILVKPRWLRKNWNSARKEVRRSDYKWRAGVLSRSVQQERSRAHAGESGSASFGVAVWSASRGPALAQTLSADTVEPGSASSSGAQVTPPASGRILELPIWQPRRPRTRRNGGQCRSDAE